MRTLFLDNFTLDDVALATQNSLEEQFKAPLKGKIDYFNTHLNESDKVTQLKKGMLEYKDTVLQANEALLDRGERLNLLGRKAGELKKDSQSYYSASKRVKKTIRWRNVKIVLFGLLIGIIVAYFISAIACGWDWTRCGSEN